MTAQLSMVDETFAAFPVLHNGSVGRLRLNGHGGRLEPRFGRFPFGSWNQQTIFPLLGMKQRKKRHEPDVPNKKSIFYETENSCWITVPNRG